jgi:serine/threonine protein kinase
MQGHPESTDVQEAACGALEALGLNADNKVKVASEGSWVLRSRLPSLNVPEISRLENMLSLASTDAQHSQGSRSSEGHPASTRNHEPSPQMKGYVFHGKLGSGGQGTVWLACRQCDKTRVAIKICQGKHQQKQKREVENLHALTRLNHPNVVRFVDYLEQDNALVMEYIDGLSLKIHLHQCNGKLEWEEASIAMRGILSGLQQLHSTPGNPVCPSARIQKVSLLHKGKCL